MHIARRFTTSGRDPYESVAFRTATSEIRNPDGSVVFAAEGIAVPAEWSQVACDILAQKYLRTAGVRAKTAPVAHDGNAASQRHRHGLIVGDEHCRGAQICLQPGQLNAHLDPEFGVQVGERLIHEEGLGIAYDRAPYGDALPLAAG